MTQSSWLVSIEQASDRVLRTYATPCLGACLAILFLWALLPSPPIPDPDVFARLAVGKLIVGNGVVSDQDPFAFTARLPQWIDHEWLSGLIFYGAWCLDGERALYLVQILALVATVALLMASQRLLVRSPVANLALFVLAVVPCVYLWTTTVRSQIFTYIFTAYLFLALVRYAVHKEGKLLLAFPILMLIWANAHGGFVVGLGLLGISSCIFLARGRLLPIAVLGVSVLVTAINPYGPVTYWRYIISAVGMSRRGIDEWLPLNPFSAAGLIPTLLLALVGVGAILKIKHRQGTYLDLLWGMIIVTCALFGFTHFRLVALLLMALAVFGAPFIEAISQRFASLSAATLRVCLWLGAPCLLVAAWSVTGALSNLRALSFDFRSYPVSAVNYLKSVQKGGNVLVSFNAGSYVIWNLYPRFKVALDGRYEELYPDSTVYSVARALDPRHPGYLQALNEIDPDFIILPSELTASYTPQYPVVFSDGEFAVLRRPQKVLTQEAH